MPVGTTNLRVASGQVAVKSSKGMRGTSAGAAIAADVDEWRFQYFDVVNGVAQTTLSGSRTQTRTELVGWRPPPGTTVTETCTWNLAKSGGVAGGSVAGGASAKGGAIGSGGAGTGGAAGAATAPSGGASSKLGGDVGGAAGAGAAKSDASSAAGASTKPIDGGAAPAGGVAGSAAAGRAAGSGGAGGAAGSGAAGSAAAGVAGAKGGATSGTSTATSTADINRQYTAIGRTPTPGTGVVFATLSAPSGGPLVGVPLTDIHLVKGSSQPVGLGPYVFGAVGDIVDNSTLGVTFAFNGLSRIAFLDVPVGTFTLTVSAFVAGNVQTRSVPVTTTAGAASVVQLSGSGGTSIP